VPATATLSATTVPEVLSLNRTRFVYRECSAVKRGSVELCNRFFSITVAHFHKTESPGAAGVAISDDADRFDLTGLCEQAVEIVFRRLKRQIS
jgi:hypothetical protein